VTPTKTKHFEAMDYRTLPQFMAQLCERTDIAARALEFCILTCARTNEVLGAKWGEISFDERLWTIPAARTKRKRPHRVPLSDRCVDILRSLPRKARPSVDDFIFPGQSGGKASHMAMLKVLKGYDQSLTVHGTARSSFRDWAGDCTSFPRETTEAALAHQVGDSTERAYRRSDDLAKRRRLMDAWAEYLEGPGIRGVVTPLRA